MKSILFISPGNARIPSFEYRCKHALQKLGCEVSTINYRKHQMHRFPITNAIVNKLIEKKVKDMNPDLVFVIKGETIKDGVIQRISDAGIKTASWYLDDPFGEFSIKNKVTNLTEYDVSMVFDPYYVDKLKEIGQQNCHYLPLGVDPEIHKEEVPFEKRKYLYDVSFLGSHDPSREKALEKISDKITDIWGYRWQNIPKDSDLYPKVHSKIYHANKSMEDMKKTCEIFNLSKINLNVHNLHSRQGVNLRTFEIPATKSFQLCDYLSEIPKLFKPKKEIVTYESTEDMRELIDYYKENKEERHKISLAGYKRAVKDHTYMDRMMRLLDIVKLD